MHLDVVTVLILEEIDIFVGGSGSQQQTVLRKLKVVDCLDAAVVVARHDFLPVLPDDQVARVRSTSNDMAAFLQPKCRKRCNLGTDWPHVNQLVRCNIEGLDKAIVTSNHDSLAVLLQNAEGFLLTIDFCDNINALCLHLGALGTSVLGQRDLNNVTLDSQDQKAVLAVVNSLDVEAQQLKWELAQFNRFCTNLQILVPQMNKASPGADCYSFEASSHASHFVLVVS